MRATAFEIQANFHCYILWSSDIVSETKVWLKEGMSDVFLKSVSSQCARGKSSAGEKRMTIPKFLSGKNFFKNVTLQIFNFILVSYLIKIFPMWMLC